MKIIAIILVVCIWIVIIWSIFKAGENENTSSKTKICAYGLMVSAGLFFAVFSGDVVVGILMFLCFGLIPLIMLINELKDIIQYRKPKKKNTNKDDDTNG